MKLQSWTSWWRWREVVVIVTLRTKFGDVELEHYDMGNVGLRYPTSTLWDGAEALMTIDTGKRPNYDPELGVTHNEVSSSQLYMADILVKESYY